MILSVQTPDPSSLAHSVLPAIKLSVCPRFVELMLDSHTCTVSVACTSNSHSPVAFSIPSGSALIVSRRILKSFHLKFSRYQMGTPFVNLFKLTMICTTFAYRKYRRIAN